MIAEVQPLRPLILRDKDAALAIGRSVAWIRQKRMEDKRALKKGRATAGPRWIVIGPSVFYRVVDLEQWIAANAVDRGVAAFANRSGP